MKKIIFLLFATFLAILKVQATTTTNGVNIFYQDNSNFFTLQCTYKDGTRLVLEKDATNATIDIIWGNSKSENLENYKWYDLITNKMLETFNLIDKNGTYDCPLYFNAKIDSKTKLITGFEGFYNDYKNIKFGNDHKYWELDKTNNSFCSGKCNGELNLQDDYYRCLYRSASYKGSYYFLKLKYDGMPQIHYPSGSDYSEVNSSYGVASDCADIFYNFNTKEVIPITYDISSCVTDSCKDLYLKLYNDKDNYVYFCQNNTCKFPQNKNINYDLVSQQLASEEILGNICSEGNIVKTLKFVGYILMAVKIIIPLILIIYGSIDFGKALITNNDDSVKKATNSFITRVIAAVIIFFIPTIVNFIFHGILNVNSNGGIYENCRVCIFDVKNCTEG